MLLKILYIAVPKKLFASEDDEYHRELYKEHDKMVADGTLQ